MDQNSDKGTCLSDQVYFNKFFTFVDETNFTDMKSNNILTIESYGKSGKLLEIGAGGGHISYSLSKDFDEIVMIEPNPLFQDLVKEKFDKKGYKNYSYLNMFFEEYYTKNKDKKFDLIICSHVLYHVHETNRKEFIQNAYSLLNDNGVLVIIMESKNNSYWKFKKNYDGEKESTSEGVNKLCTELGYSFESKAFNSDSNFNSGNLEKDFEDCFEFLYFMVVENFYVASDFRKMNHEQIHSLEKQIRKDTWSLKKEDNSFYMYFQDEYFKITKK